MFFFFVLTIWTQTKFYWSVPLSAPLQYEKRRGNEQKERRRWEASPLLFLPLYNEANTQSSRCQIKIMTNFISGQPNLNHAVSSVRANSTAFLAILQLSSFTRVSQSLKAPSFIASNANSWLSEQIQLRTTTACSIAGELPLPATPESTDTMPGILQSCWSPSPRFDIGCISLII